jgi:hypothetical protein
MLVSFPPHPTKPLVHPSCTLYEKQFRFPVAIFFYSYTFVLKQRSSASAVHWAAVFGVGVGVGWETSCGWGMTYCRLLKWAWVGIWKAWGGEGIL